MVNGLYQVEHQGDVDLAAAVDPEVVSIEKLHQLMGHIAPEAAEMLLEKGLVESFKLDTSSQMLKSCNACEYGKAHGKPVKKECEAPKAAKIGDEVHSDVWGPSPVQMMAVGSITPHIWMIIQGSPNFTFNVSKVRLFSLINDMKPFCYVRKGLILRSYKPIVEGSI